MVIRTPEDIDFSTFPESDGEAMAETRANVVQMVDLVWELQALFDLQGRAPVTVAGNQFVYYNPHNGRDNLSPDVYVVFGVAVLAPDKWRTWVEGKFPDIVFEITSPSTQGQDLSEGPRGKRRLYAELGAREYYIYDPLQEMDPSFLGFELRAGRMQPLPFLPSGGIASPLLGTELRPVAMTPVNWHPAGVWLRVIDPRTGEPIPIPDEEREDLHATRERLTTTQGRLNETQGRLTEEMQARRAAEEQAAQARAELESLRAELARRRDSGSTP